MDTFYKKIKIEFPTIIAEPNSSIGGYSTPNDPAYNQQWNLWKACEVHNDYLGLGLEERLEPAAASLIRPVSDGEMQIDSRWRRFAKWY